MAPGQCGESGIVRLPILSSFSSGQLVAKVQPSSIGAEQTLAIRGTGAQGRAGAGEKSGRRNWKTARYLKAWWFK